MIQRRVVVCGNSKVVALPPAWLRLNRIRKSDSVDLFYGSVVIVVPKGIKLNSEVLRHEMNQLTRLYNTELEDGEGLTSTDDDTN